MNPYADQCANGHHDLVGAPHYLASQLCPRCDKFVDPPKCCVEFYDRAKAGLQAALPIKVKP